MEHSDRISKYEKALNYLKLAKQELSDIAAEEHLDDARGFVEQVSEIISCDHGQAGLEALIKKIRN